MRSRVLHFLTIIVLLLSTGCSDWHKSSENIRVRAALESAVELRDFMDRYYELEQRVFRPALRLSDPYHKRSAEEALETIAMFEEQLDSEVEDMSLAIDDRIDLILFQMTISDMKQNLVSSLHDEVEIMKLLPAADLRLNLPDLTGLVQDSDLNEGRESLNQALDGIPSDAASLPDGVTLVHARAVADRARGLSREVDNWIRRAKDRFYGKTGNVETDTKRVKSRLDKFSKLIRSDLIAKLEDKNEAYGSPVGRDRFAAMLINKHMIMETPEELLEFGKVQIELITGQIEETARRINPDKTVDEVWEEIQLEHPAREELPQFAYNEMQSALNFLLEKDVVSIPENARKNVMLLTEGRTYNTYPFGGYGLYSYRGRDIVGRFLTSPPKAHVDTEASIMRLKGNNKYWAKVVAVHEMYPGHHLQYVIRDQKSRTMRRRFYTTTYAEGWALYTEDLMHRLGYFNDDKTVMTMLIMRNWRAARIVIDVSLQLKLMKFDEAIDYLMKHARMNRENALAEVRRYIGNPTRPLSYLYGFRQIEALRAAYMKNMGEAYSDKEFHDTLLEFGPIPIPLIRAKMLGEPLPERRKQ